MIQKNIAAFTQPHNDMPAFISINQVENGAVIIEVRSEGNTGAHASITLTGNEFKQLVGEIVMTGLE